MATKIFGTINEFCADTESFNEWVERLDQWFLANEIVNADRKRALLLSFIGPRGYKLVRSLAQNEPATKSYGELITLMKDHLQPKPNVISQRYIFYKRDRNMEESVKDYVAELRKLSEFCNFGNNLSECLRDRLVCGLNSEKIQQSLLAAKELDLQKAIDISVAMEEAVKNAKKLHGGGDMNSIYKVGLGNAGGNENNSGEGRYTTRKECYRCGSTGHLADVCPFKNKECFSCNQTGHIRRKCYMYNRKKETWSSSKNVNYVTTGKDNEHVEDNQESLESGMDFLSLYTLEIEGRNKIKPVMVPVELNGKKVSMKVDTGAAVSVMSLDKYWDIGGRKLKDVDLKLKTYTGEIVKPRGEGKIDVRYKGQKLVLPIIVMEGAVQTLLGKDWLEKIHLDWEELFPFAAHNIQEEGEDKVERKELGICDGEQSQWKNFRTDRITNAVDETSKMSTITDICGNQELGISDIDLEGNDTAEMDLNGQNLEDLVTSVGNTEMKVTTDGNFNGQNLGEEVEESINEKESLTGRQDEVIGESIDILRKSDEENCIIAFSNIAEGVGNGQQRSTLTGNVQCEVKGKRLKTDIFDESDDGLIATVEGGEEGQNRQKLSRARDTDKIGSLEEVRKKGKKRIRNSVVKRIIGSLANVHRHVSHLLGRSRNIGNELEINNIENSRLTKDQIAPMSRRAKRTVCKPVRLSDEFVTS